MTEINTEEYNHSFFIPLTAEHEQICERLNDSLKIFSLDKFKDFKPYRIVTNKMDAPQSIMLDGQPVAVGRGTMFTVYAKRIKE